MEPHQAQPDDPKLQQFWSSLVYQLGSATGGEICRQRRWPHEQGGYSRHRQRLPRQRVTEQFCLTWSNGDTAVTTYSRFGISGLGRSCTATSPPHVNLIMTSPRAWWSRLSHPPSSTRLLRRRPSGIAGIGVAVAQHDAALTLEDFVATFGGPLAVEYAGLVVVVGPFQAGITAGQLHGGCGAARSQSQRDQCDSGDQIGTAQQGKHGD